MLDLRKTDDEACCLLLKDIKSAAPFTHGLEYNPPARGVWNIVHIGMLLPESHTIFFCPVSCMRGVVMTAAEMGALDRFSSIFLTEKDLLDGDCENVIIDGVSEIIAKLLSRPKAIILFTNCLDKFIGVDHEFVYSALRKAFPDIGFAECFMCPTLRKTTLPPDPVMRKQLYSLLEPSEKKRRAVNFIGNNIPLPRENELVKMLLAAGYEVRDIKNCKTFAQYKTMSESVFNIMINPAGEMACDELEKRLGIPALKIPLSYDYGEIESALAKASRALGLKMPDAGALKTKAEKSIKKAALAVGGRPVWVDYTATSRPFGLAKLLAEHGFNVAGIYADTCSKPDYPALCWLKEHAGNIKWRFPYDPKMAVSQKTGEDALAIGQDAAYFSGTKHFVNIVESDGLYGFDGICRLMALICDAAENEKDARRLIQIKGLGCCR